MLLKNKADVDMRDMKGFVHQHRETGHGLWTHMTKRSKSGVSATPDIRRSLFAAQVHSVDVGLCFWKH